MGRWMMPRIMPFKKTRYVDSSVISSPPSRLISGGPIGVNWQG